MKKIALLSTAIIGTTLLITGCTPYAEVTQTTTTTKTKYYAVPTCCTTNNCINKVCPTIKPKKQNIKNTNSSNLKQTININTPLSMKQGTPKSQRLSKTPGLINKGIIKVEVTGIGVPPTSSISPAQATAMARRSAIIDGYKALTEKIYGIKINGRDTVKDMVLQNSTLRSYLEGVIRGANIIDEQYKNGMYKVVMTLKLNIRKWNDYLEDNPPYSSDIYDSYAY